jgi:hypothetical protein
MTDWAEILGIGMAALIVLIPITGFTLRFAIKPISEAIAQMRGGPSGSGEVAALRQQVESLQHQMSGIESSMHRLVEAQEFQAELLRPPANADQS